MALDLQCSQNLYEEAGRIDLSHAIKTLLGDDKENDDLSLQLLTSSSTSHNNLDSSSSINKTPHDSCLDKTAARAHCRKLENGDTTPKKKQEARRHLNSVNILCRSKKRKMESRRYSDNGKPLALDGSKSARLVASGSGRFGPLQTLHDSNVQIVNMDSSSNPGVMVKDSLGKLHPAEFVPVMVEERNGGFFMSPNNDNLNNNQGILNYQESRGNGQDDSLTNITWLKRMSAPGVDSVESSEPCQLQHFPDPECERPPYSYSALIQFALISTPAGKMTLKDIYEWIQTNFPFFKTAKLGWKNSIRHNLSLHKIFIREPPGELGKPAFWTLRPGTVVRLPENRLFVMENKGEKTNGGRNSLSGKVCIKQADGTTELVSEKFLQAPTKPKPILPRCSTGYTFLTMVPGCQLERSGKKARYAKIAPKQTSHPVYHLSVPHTSSGRNLNSPEEIVSFQTPQRWDSCQEQRPERSNEPQEDESRNKPVMSTPLRTSRSELMETMGSLTPFNDDDYTLLRSQADILNITPIKGSGMTPVIKDILSQTSDLDVTPARPTQSRQSLLTTPRVDKQNISIDLEDLFGTGDRSDGLPDDFQNCSFSQLFSPMSKK